MNSQLSRFRLRLSTVIVQVATNNELLLRASQLRQAVDFFLRTQEETLTELVRRERCAFGCTLKPTLIICFESFWGIFCMLWPFCIF